MVDSFRKYAILAGITVAMTTGLLSSRADDPSARDKEKEKDKAKAAKAPRTLDDPPTPFVPLHPRTVDDQNRIEALRLYAAARALEDKFQIGTGPRGGDFRQPVDDAIGLLEKAQKLDPESVTILRRLSKLNFLVGRNEPAVAYGRKLLELDPGDSATLSLLIAHYIERKGDANAAEKLLQKVASSPNLDKTSPGYFVIQRNLGDLYADLLSQPEKAADAYAKLMDALEQKAANALSALDQKRILEGDEAASYLKFGETFLQAKKVDLAIRAFRKGLLYKADHASIPRYLAEALLKAGKPEEALAVLDAFLKRQPAGGEAYEVLVDILKTLKKEGQILPRLIELARLDPNNFRLQLLLAEHYRADGQVEKADAVLQRVKANQSEPQLYGALAASYLKAKRAEDLVKILGECLAKLKSADAVGPQVEALSKDGELVDKCLDVGLKLLADNPAELSDECRKVLVFVARRAKRFDKLVQLDRAILKQSPTSKNLQEMFADMEVAEQFDAAEKAAEEFFARYPAERTGDNLIYLAGVQSAGGKFTAAVATGREADRLEPNNPKILFMLAYYLSRAGKEDDAIAMYQALIQKAGPVNGDNEGYIRRLLINVCNCYLSKGDNAKYEEEMEALYKKDPDDIGVNNDLGYYWADQGKNLDRAEAMIRKALDEQPEEPAYLDSFGWVLFKRGKAKEAVEPLEKAAASRADATICEHLADVLFRLQDYSRAKDYYRKAEAHAAKATPPDKRLADIRKKLSDLEKLGPTPAAKAPGNGDRP